MQYEEIFHVCVTLKTTKNVRIDKAFKCKAYHEQNIFLAIVDVYAYCKHTYFSAFTTIRFLANNPSSTWHAFKISCLKRRCIIHHLLHNPVYRLQQETCIKSSLKNNKLCYST